jgi:hypothetical protein
MVGWSFLLVQLPYWAGFFPNPGGGPGHIHEDLRVGQSLAQHVQPLDGTKKKRDSALASSVKASEPSA